MKRILLLQLLTLAFVCSVTAQQFTLKGKLGKQAEGATILLTYQSSGEYRNDSVKVKHGKFQLTVTVTEPVKAQVNLVSAGKKGGENSHHNADNTEVFLEPGTITLRSSNGKVSTAIIRGGSGQKDLVVLQKRLKPAYDQLAPLMDSMLHYFGKDEAAVNKFRKLSQPVYESMNKINAAFVAEYPDSYLSLSLVKDQSLFIEVDKFGPLFNSLSERLKNTNAGKAMAARLEIARKTAIGKQAMDFVQPDTTGTPLSLSSLKGKYVLVDFWASWCGPCREENPYLVKAYEKFRNRNFEIIGVSLDAQKGAWLSAIRQDGLQWLQVSDLKGPRNEVAKQYDIRAVPQNFLVDPDGVIIAKNLRALQLEEKLNEVLKN